MMIIMINMKIVDENDENDGDDYSVNDKMILMMKMMIILLIR